MSKIVPDKILEKKIEFIQKSLLSRLIYPVSPKINPRGWELREISMLEEAVRFLLEDLVSTVGEKARRKELTEKKIVYGEDSMHYGEAIRELFLAKPGIMSVELGEELGISRAAVGRHVRKIRKSWGGREKFSSHKGGERPDKRARILVELPNLFEEEGEK